MAQEHRVVRVFVSSTFRDMQEEREELIKHIFPQLRKLCESRGVVWGEVDLRWGITDEATAEGKVLPICLAEIHRCRPYFIGLLGERYGWVPEEIPPELLEREPWLTEHLQQSVTELEIVHGVLRHPEMADHAFFYLRDPAYAESRPAAQQADFRSEDLPDQAKLAYLKGRIRTSGLPVQENYRDPRELGELVRRDLTAVIDRLFPAGSQPDPLEREAAAHEAYARSRAVVEVRPGEFSGVYIGRQDYFQRLDEHVRGDGPPLVVLGESGAGKSALLANWALRYRAESTREDDAPPPTKKSFWGRIKEAVKPAAASPAEARPGIIMHFIGADPTSADWAAMLRRLLGELQRHFAIESEIPDQPDALRLAFANLLSLAAAKGRVVLIIDALNQLEDREGAPDLVWLPPVIPPNVRLILSTLPGRPLEELRQRGWPSLAVAPLEEDERRELITAYLAQYTKELSPAEVGRLAGAPATANPLYLRALLEELRVYGDHHTLKARLEHYLTAPGVKELYELILARYEADYQRERPGLVGEAFSLLAAARRGLTQAELLDLLGRDGEPLPGAVWSPLSLAAEPALMDRGGLITFGHDYVRQAVGDRYLDDEARRRAVHLRLADYFGAQELEMGEGPNLRKIDELPWQLARAGAWEGLQGLLTEPAFFRRAWEQDQFEVKACWSQIESNSPLRLAASYQGVLADPARQEAGYVWNVALLLADTGHPEEALALRTLLTEHYRRAGDWDNLSGSLGNQAIILKARGDLDGAMALHQEEERLCRELGKKDGLQACLGHQAGILYTRGDLDGAMALHKEKERLCRELGNKDGLSASLGNQALILQARGNLDGAMELHKESERLCRELGDKDGLSASLGNQANILYSRGDLDGAMALYEEQERLCREMGNKDGLQRTLGNQAIILAARGDLDGAMDLHKESERLCRELGDKDGMSASLGNQANILYARGDLDGALDLHKEAERLCQELGNKDGLQRTLGNQANILYARGDLDGAMDLHKESERLCRELGHKDGLQRTLGNQANILCVRGDLDGAMALHKEKERLCRELGHKNGLSACLGNQAVILKVRGDLDGAMDLHKEAERLCRELGDKNGLSACLGNQAVILKVRGNLDGAMDLHKEAERLCRELGDKDGLSASLGNQANILFAWGDLDGAMALHKEEERLCRELGHKDGLSACLGNQANILAARGDLDGTLALYKEQERLCRELGHKNGLSACLGNQANILYVRGDLDGAMALHKEKERLCRELGNKDSLSISLGNQANILYVRGDLDGAMALHQEEERLCRELGDKNGLSACLGNQAVILKVRGDLDGALDLHKEAERLCQELGNKDGLAISLGNQANILFAWGDLDGAMALHKEEERLCWELGNKSGLSYCLAGQGLILKARGDLDGAMALHKEQERLCRELGNKDGLQRTLGNQANILYARGDLDGAMALYKEQERLCLELGNSKDLAISLANQAELLSEKLGRHQEALPLAEEAHRLAAAHGYAALAGQIKDILDKVRSAKEKK